VEITATFPSGPVADTKSSLEKAIAGENMTWTVRYANFAEVANGEGFQKIARLFEGIAVAENYHEERLKKLLDNITRSEVFKKKTAVTWHCLNCGYVTQGKSAPKSCPACEYPRAFYEVLAESD
jgi:rubrerythrin